jgi:hypothetical protein
MAPGYPARAMRRSVPLTADHVKHHVNLAGVFQLVGLQIQERVHSQTEGCVALRGPARADHEGSQLAGELHGDQTDTVRRRGSGRSGPS